MIGASDSLYGGYEFERHTNGLVGEISTRARDRSLKSIEPFSSNFFNFTFGEQCSRKRDTKKGIIYDQLLVEFDDSNWSHLLMVSLTMTSSSHLCHIFSRMRILLSQLRWLIIEFLFVTLKNQRRQLVLFISLFNYSKTLVKKKTIKQTNGFQINLVIMNCVKFCQHQHSEY